MQEWDRTSTPKMLNKAKANYDPELNPTGFEVQHSATNAFLSYSFLQLLLCVFWTCYLPPTLQ